MLRECFLLISLFLIFSVFFSRSCLSNNESLLNGSFEKGVLNPDGWSLSGGTGTWENEGYDGKRSISVTGTGVNEESNYWKCDSYKLLPKQTYRLSFMSRVSLDSSGGAVVTGSNFINRDYSIGTQWENRSFVFTTPNDTSDVFLRFGQWQKSGKVWFDDIKINSVIANHKRKDDLQLGSGERIQKGKYTFRHDLNGDGSNSARVLYSHTAGFNSNRWLMGNGSEVVYKHQIGNYQQKNVSVAVEIGYYQNGKCIVEAGVDGKSWQSLGELTGLGRQEFTIPESLLPANEVFIRLRGIDYDDKPASFQIYGYTYTSQLEGESIPDIIGETHYSDILQSSGELDVNIISLGDLKPGKGNSVNLRLENKEKFPIRLAISLSLKGAETADDTTETFTVPADGTRDVNIGYEIHKAGDFELLISAITPDKKELYTSRTLFSVPQLYSADYGYTLAEDNECSIWWAEGTYKISKERVSPVQKEDKILISSARNEYEPFQLVIRAKSDMKNVSIEVSPLTNTSGFSISSVDVSLVGYIYVKIPTDRIGTIGYWPDPLPFYEKPFSVRAGENQPIWVTVHVPSDAPAGDYDGKITLRSGSWSQEINALLHVWDFALPKETHVRSALGFSPWLLKRYHHLDTDDELRAVIHKYYENFASHRISPYNPTASMQVQFNPSNPDDVKIDFEAFDKSARLYFDEMGFNSLQLPIQGMGGGTFQSRHLGEIAGYKQGTPEYERMFKSYLSQIQDHLEANGWLDKAYVYWFDEPEPKDYEFVKDGMALIHRAGPKLTRFLTEQPEPELYGSVELWCPVTPEFNYQRAEERRKLGEHFWWYICTGPKEPYCTLFIDHYATELRTWLWQTWKYKVEGILVWQTNYWTSSLVYPEPNLQNPYDDSMSYVSGYGNPVGYVGYWGNGDGRFIYPPVDAMEGKKSLSGPVNSIRWEMLREGIEDYEYLWLLRDMVNSLKENDSTKTSPLLEEAEKLLEVPENITSGMTEFTKDPKPIYFQRENIARMIEELQRLILALK